MNKKYNIPDESKKVIDEIKRLENKTTKWKVHTPEDIIVSTIIMEDIKRALNILHPKNNNNLLDK